MNHNVCPKCSNKSTYSERFDCFLCVLCNIWLNPICEDKTCSFCKDRTSVPSTTFLGFPKTYTEVDTLYSLAHLRVMMASGEIIQDDGNTGAIFIDGVHRPEFYIQGWDDGPVDPVAKKLSNAISLDNIDKLFPGKTIQIEWLNR